MIKLLRIIKFIFYFSLFVFHFSLTAQVNVTVYGGAGEVKLFSYFTVGIPVLLQLNNTS